MSATGEYTNPVFRSSAIVRAPGNVLTFPTSEYAAQRMLERNISVADVLIALNSGATIEDYPDDTPFPSRLTLGWVE